MSGTKVDGCLGPRPYICASEVHCQIALPCQKWLWYEYDNPQLDAVIFLPDGAETLKTYHFYVGFNCCVYFFFFFKWHNSLQTGFRLLVAWENELCPELYGPFDKAFQRWTVAGVQPWLNVLNILWGRWHKYLCLENLWQPNLDHVSINQIVS